ncbi:MAG: hypothetical protein ABUT39_13655 [Acidobacteriota bacterium]
MSGRIVRFASALALAASLAVPAAHAAGPLQAGSAGSSLFDLVRTWLATAWSDKGFTIDPDGGTVNGDRGFGIDPDGLTVQMPDPRATSEEGDRGFSIDPNG